MLLLMGPLEKLLTDNPDCCKLVSFQLKKWLIHCSACIKLCPVMFILYNTSPVLDDLLQKYCDSMMGQ